MTALAMPLAYARATPLSSTRGAKISRVGFRVFQEQIDAVREVAGFAEAGGHKHAKLRILWINLSCGLEIIGRSAVILTDQADIAEDSEDFDLLVIAQGNEFPAFFENFDRIDVFVLFSECERVVDACREIVRVNLQGVLKVGAGVREFFFIEEEQTALKEFLNAKEVGS